MAKFCTKCGATLNDTDSFCASCGTPVAEKEVAAYETKLETAKKIEHEKKISNCGEVLNSAAPIAKKHPGVKWAYIACFIIGALTAGSGLVLLLFVYVYDCYAMKAQQRKIRNQKFKFVSPVTVDEIYNKLQPALVKKYGNSVDFEREGDSLTISYKSVLFDINLNEDNTFSIWWRKSIAGAIFSINEWKMDKKVRVGTPMIAYELQHEFGVR